MRLRILLGLVLLPIVGCSAHKPAKQPTVVADLDKCVRLYSVSKDTECKPVPGTALMHCKGDFTVTVDCYKLINRK